MKRHCIYKIKESSKELFLESYLSEYVIVEEFAINPLQKESETNAVFKHIFIDTFEYTSHIIGYYSLPCNEFEKHFDLYMETSELNKKLIELRQK